MEPSFTLAQNMRRARLHVDNITWELKDRIAGLLESYDDKATVKAMHNGEEFFIITYRGLDFFVKVHGAQDTFGRVLEQVKKDSAP